MTQSIPYAIAAIDPAANHFRDFLYLLAVEVIVIIGGGALLNGALGCPN